MTPERKTKAWMERYEAQERRHREICMLEEDLHNMTVRQAIELVGGTLGEEDADELSDFVGELAEKIHAAER